jgi:hypothetical protein
MIILKWIALIILWPFIVIWMAWLGPLYTKLTGKEYNFK